MIRNFKIRLTLIILVFSIIVSFSVAFLNFRQMEKLAEREYSEKLQLVEETVVNSLKSVDGAYELFDTEITDRMKWNSEELLKRYSENPDVKSWDLIVLKQKFNMDIYVIDSRDKIVQSTDVSIAEKETERLFSNLDERRNGLAFIEEPMKLQQKDGEIKKYGYVPSPDHEYLFVLAYSISDKTIYHTFNFLVAAEELIYTHDSLNAIHIYETDGSLVDGARTMEDDENPVIAESKKAVFENVLANGKTLEMEGEWEGGDVFYRYIPYTALNSQGMPVQRIIEMVRNDQELKAVSMEYKQNFIWSLLLILAMAIILSYLIAHWLARPIYLAFHDSLTGLKNRAAFDDCLKALLQKKDSKPVLMMMDLDNFKLVNDFLGHDGGDGFLMRTAAIIQHHAGREIVAARLGGDEFAVIFPEAHQETIERTASLLIREMRTLMLQEPGTDAIDVTVSIGIAFGQENDDAETLYKKADLALYESKNFGKNQYRFFTGDAINV
ncbi:putative diguanylate cyclase YegE [Planococcus massiliensis]|uniref:Putative diguanylate cyclase YegE n=1 Tax=Planococcus massiliensis TaxID=1499687 RepID=A0A098EHG6_9BACL|nr:GGDEF domain-containing protein [Planococcus massiliensis]CEG21749.1 putative diguanylate cyclase YegE [Planococcus massiliensis]